MIRIIPKRAQAFSDAEAVLADAMETLLPGLDSLAAIETYAPNPDDIDLTVLLGGAEQARGYGIDPNVSGFLATASEERWDEEDIYRKWGWHVVQLGFEANVNVEVIHAGMAERWLELDEAGRADELKTALTSMVREVVHVLEWISLTGGKTPNDIYRAGEDNLESDGKEAIEDVLKAIKEKRGGDGSGGTPASLAKEWAGCVFPPSRIKHWVERLDAVMVRNGPTP